MLYATFFDIFTKSKTGVIDEVPIEIHQLVRKKFLFKPSIKESNISNPRSTYIVVVIMEDSQLLESFTRATLMDKDSEIPILSADHTNEVFSHILQ